jgi:hypothetical protein
MKSFWCTRTYRVSDAHVKRFAKVAMNLAVKNGDVSFRPFNRRQRKRGGHFGLPFCGKLFPFRRKQLEVEPEAKLHRSRRVRLGHTCELNSTKAAQCAPITGITEDQIRIGQLVMVE